MASIIPPPKSPTEWQKYANSSVIATLPSRQDTRLEDNKTRLFQRDVYLDASTVFGLPMQEISIYVDVLAFTEKETIIPAPQYGVIRIFARVLTADIPINLKFSPECVVFIYASVLDQEFTVSCGNMKPIPLEIGVLANENFGHVGAHLTTHSDDMNVSYKKEYTEEGNNDFQVSLETQLRIALALSWQEVSIAITLCAHVSSAAVKQDPKLILQAAALGQQLAVQTMTGPDMGYAPVLLLKEYKDTLKDALDAVSDFEARYTRFHDKEEALEIQLQAWDTMLQHAIDERAIRAVLRKSAMGKYGDASDVVVRCHWKLVDDTAGLSTARDTFIDGLRHWEADQQHRAAFQLLSSVIGLFALGIGTLSAGDLHAIGDVNDAITQAKMADNIDHQLDKFIIPSTLEDLGGCMKALEGLYVEVDGFVQAVQRLESDPNTPIDPIGMISGSSQGDANANKIATLSGWDKWTDQCDSQLEFAVGKNIPGSREYRLALRTHAVNGKQAAQAQAEAVKAAHEYIQAEMDFILSERDIASLQALREQYKGQKEVWAQAEAMYFDRFLAIRTSLAIEMRNMLWAYKYWALADSQVVLDSQKSAADFRADLFAIDREIETANSRYSSDLQPFHFRVSSDDLPSTYGTLIKDGFQSDTHSASFALVPDSGSPNEQSLASVFTSGSHFRLDGLEVILRGAVPQQGNKARVDIQIMTSGVYADIQDSKVFQFTSLPRSVRFSYDINSEGEPGDIHIHAAFPTESHAEPTPFTQWTVKLLRPDWLDLSGLTGVDLVWTGHARFDA